MLRLRDHKMLLDARRISFATIQLDGTRLQTSGFREPFAVVRPIRIIWKLELCR